MSQKVEGFSDIHTSDDTRPLFWHQHHQWGANGPGIHPFTSVRRGDWKLIYFHADQNFELFNLKNDIGEENDLATAEPERAKQLAEVMSLWIDDKNVQLSIDKTTGRPIALPGDIANRD